MVSWASFPLINHQLPGNPRTKPSELGFSPEGSGEPLKVLGKGMTWPDLCFRTISLAAMRMAGGAKSRGRLLGETKEACAVFQMGDLGLPVKDTDNVDKEISTIYLKALCQTLKEKNTHAWWSKCTAE